MLVPVQYLSVAFDHQKIHGDIYNNLPASFLPFPVALSFPPLILYVLFLKSFFLVHLQYVLPSFWNSGMQRDLEKSFANLGACSKLAASKSSYIFVIKYDFSFCPVLLTHD